MRFQTDIRVRLFWDSPPLIASLLRLFASTAFGEIPNSSAPSSAVAAEADAADAKDVVYFEDDAKEDDADAMLDKEIETEASFFGVTSGFEPSFSLRLAARLASRRFAFSTSHRRISSTIFEGKENGE